MTMTVTTTLMSTGNLEMIQHSSGDVTVRHAVTGWQSHALTTDEQRAVLSGELGLASIDLYEGAISLRDYVQHVAAPILHVTSAGGPVSQALLLGYVDASDYLPGLLDLEGTVSAGVWSWDGEGDVVDARGNTVRLVQVTADAARFAAELADYESAA